MMGKGYKPAGEDDVTMSSVAWGGFSLAISRIDRQALGVGQAGNWIEWSRETGRDAEMDGERWDVIDGCVW